MTIKVSRSVYLVYLLEPQQLRPVLLATSTG